MRPGRTHGRADSPPDVYASAINNATGARGLDDDIRGVEELGRRLVTADGDAERHDATDLETIERDERVDVGEVVTGEQHRAEVVSTGEPFDRVTLHRPAVRHQLDHHLSLDEIEPALGRHALERNGQRATRDDGIRRLTVLDGDRGALVLDPCLGHLRGGRLDERDDRHDELGRLILHPVQADVPQVRHVDEPRCLLRTATRDDGDEAIPRRNGSQRLASTLDGTRQVWTRDDLGQRAVEVENDPAGAGARPKRAEISC